MTPTPPSFPTLGGDAKRSYVREMFTAIAPRYDLLNHLLSFNIDRRWRRRAVALLGWPAAPGGTYLDLCAGTMDLAAALATQPGFRGRVVGADFVVPMLRRGLGKARDLRAVGADALELPFPTAVYDGCLVGFGVRNLADVHDGFREIARVVRPGGRVVILEFATPTAWPIRPLYQFYFQRVLPWIGRTVSKHTDAYSYLPDSVTRFPEPDGVARWLAAAGFRDVRYERLTFGIAVLYIGTRDT